MEGCKEESMPFQPLGSQNKEERTRFKEGREVTRCMEGREMIGWMGECMM